MNFFKKYKMIVRQENDMFKKLFFAANSLSMNLSGFNVLLNIQHINCAVKYSLHCYTFSNKIKGEIPSQ